MPVAVVKIGVVGMPMGQALMDVGMAVRFPRRRPRRVVVPVVFVVQVSVRVLETVVLVRVLVALGQV